MLRTHSSANDDCQENDLIMTHQRNQPTKKSASVKARKWEKLVGWSIEPDYDSSYIDNIEAWSKRRYNEGTADVEYLCSNNHLCSGISDWDSFIEASLEKQGKDAASIECEEIRQEDGSNTEEVYEKAKKELHKSDIEKGRPAESRPSTEPITLNKAPREQTMGLYGGSSVENGECTGLNDEESEHRCVRVRPISSNSLPEKKLTCRSMPPRRNALSANDAYTGDISSPSIKFSYTKKDTPKPMDSGSLNLSSTDIDVTESSSGQKERVAGYDFHRLQLHQAYVLPKSANVSVGDLLQSHPRIERHLKCSRDRDVVFAALAKDKDNNFSQMIRNHLLNDNIDTYHTSVGLPPVNPHTNNKDQPKGVPALKTMSSTPRIPLLTSKSTDDILLQQFNTTGADLREEISQDVTYPIYSYVTHSGCTDVDVNYTPKSQVSLMRDIMRPQPRGPPAFRPPTSKTPLHRAIQTAHKKIHGPHHHLLSQSGSRLTDKVETSTEKRRWSSSLPNKHVRHTDAVPSDVNNMNAWRQELESHIRYQRSTSNSKATARVNAPLTNPLITTNNTTITLSKLSRRKKTQLRIGDKLYNVGTIQSAGRSYAR